MGRRPGTRARAGHLVSLRVVVRHAARRRPAATRPDPRRARRGHDAEGRHAVQRAVDGRASDVHRCRIVHDLHAGRPVGGLPAVLRNVPLPAAPPGLPQPAVPSLAARTSRRDHGRAVPRLSFAARLAAARGAGACRPAGEGAGALRADRRQRPARAARRRLRRRVDPEQCGAPPADGGTSGLGAGPIHLVRLSGRAQLRRGRGRPEAGVRPAASHRRGTGRSRGTSAATPASIRVSPPSTATTCWRSTPTTW